MENIPIEFENVYEQVYKDSIYPLELIRKRARNRIFINCVSALLVLGGLIINDLLLSFVGTIGLVFFIEINVFEKNYKYTYKKNVVSKFIKLISDKLKYKDCNLNSYDIEKNIN